MSEQIVVKTFEKLVLEYSVMKYKDEEYVFVTDVRNQDLVSDKFDEFVEEVFNSDGHSFHEYVIEHTDLSIRKILVLLNWVNQYKDENFGDSKVDLELTQQKIINLFGYFCVKEKQDDILWEIRYGDDDEDNDEQEEKA
jgi:hypothetical protein